jgi:dephospho-CoA kinase
MVFLIGLTGGIASGKSTVAKLLAGHGAEIIDADEVARQVVEIGSSGLAMVVEEFGPTILHPDGTLDRAVLSDVVFADPARRVALEQILHPLIKMKTTELFSKASADVVVYSVPLLVEAKVDYPFDLVVTVEAGLENQTARLIDSRGMTAERAESITAAQATTAERAAMADLVIDSSGTLEQLSEQAHKLWNKALELSKRKKPSGAN